MAGVKLDGFFDAATARSIAMGQASANNLVMDEIYALKKAVATKAATGELQAVVGTATGAAGTSTMTANTTYFEAWNDSFSFNTPAHKIARENMNYIFNFFTRIGYAVTRSREGTTNTFNWTIQW